MQDAAFGGSAEKREKHIKQEKEAIEDEMLTMAKGMKELASGFTQQFRTDASMLDHIS